MNDLIKNPVLGAIAGDMIGVPYEFLRRGVHIERDFPLWSNDSKFSDDTAMTLAVAKWLLTEDLDKLNPRDLVLCMQEIGNKYPNVGYGGKFSQWLKEEDPQPYGSWGNGSAMRISPVGCAFKTLEDTLKIAEMSASVSHNHIEGIKGAKVIAELIYRILLYNDWETMKEPYMEGFLLVPSVDYKYKVDRTPQEIRDSGYTFKVSCQESVPEAISCFLYSHSYEETIREAILLRGDTDTQACIAGSLAAAYWGIPRDIADEALDRLPSDLLHILENFSKMYNLPL